MSLQDLVVTPVFLSLVYLAAYLVRPWVTNEDTKRYFIPALTVKIIGAIAVGLIYQFYYGGGDTFAFHTHGSRIIWEAFMDSPMKGLKLLLANGEHRGDIFNYSAQIWYFRDQQSYMVIRLAALFDLITFGTYSATAVLFAVFSFSGLWALFLTFYDRHGSLHLLLALSILFVPSVFFWGSGILKDTVTLGCLGWMTFTFYKVAIKQDPNPIWMTIFLLCAVLTFTIKKYILLSILPAFILWSFTKYVGSIRSVALKITVAPLLLTIAGAFGYYAILKVGEDDARYNIYSIAETARMTAYDIRYGWGARFGEGSGYSLGELDGTLGGMIKLAPAAINVSLFRPYVWEVRNPLMLFSALEALVSLLLTAWVFLRVGPKYFLKSLFKSDVLFCIVFSTIFAFAVGVSTYNFGTLARYKIPLLPFYFVGIILLWQYGYLNKKRLS